MAEFITGKELEKAVENIIWNAKKTLLILSPYIKLDNHFKKLFETHKTNPDLDLIIVFGKNEGNASRSMAHEDFEFFKQFQKVSIVYVANLHAKYYGNENAGVITSINLYDYSFINNIEFGVYSETKLMDILSPSADQKAWVTCKNIANQGDVVFIKRPIYKKVMLGFGKNCVGSKVLFDNTEFYYGNKYAVKQQGKRLSEYEAEIDFAAKDEPMPVRGESKQIADVSTSNINTADRKPSPIRNLINSDSEGFCIRTGTKIPFNPNRPFSEQAYRSWAQYSNPDYKENYCHKTGKESYGRTSMRNPIL